MGTQKMSGLTKRGGTWHIDKVFRGTRIRESTGSGEIVKAQELLAKRIEEIRAAQLYGVRPDRTFRAAATKFLNENQHKRSIDDDALHLSQLDPFIGNLFLKQAHLDSLQPFIASRRADGVKTTTINLALGTVRRILNLAASEWRDERGMHSDGVSARWDLKQNSTLLAKHPAIIAASLYRDHGRERDDATVVVVG